MPEVGIRELRDNLSRYIRKVQEGNEVVVTDHGNAVALIVPLDGARLVDRLVKEGVVTRPEDISRRRPAERITPSEPVSPLVAEQRR